jgi:hypothetical protein
MCEIKTKNFMQSSFETFLPSSTVLLLNYDAIKKDKIK